MSHELRTPLNAVLGFTQILSNDKNLTQTQQEKLSVIGRSGEHLLGLINDILGISKIEAGKLIINKEKTSLHTVINQCIDMMKFMAHQKNLELIVNVHKEVHCAIWVDEMRLKQILQNLLNNAVKFTQKGQIELEVCANNLNDNSSKIRFSVKDTGIGIKNENKKKILEAFTQEDSSTTRNYGGTGLGLTITNSLLKLMNILLLLQSEPQLDQRSDCCH